MKKSRLVIVITLLCVVVLIIVLGSPLFCLSKVEVIFVDSNYNKVKFENTKTYKKNNTINSVVNSVDFDYGTSMFLLDKNFYKQKLENKNPLIKIVDITSIFPNKLLLTVTERLSVFYIKTNNNYCVLDAEFNIVEILSSLNENEHKNAINIQTKNSFNTQKDFFDFFNINFNSFEPGQNLSENNKLLGCIKTLITELTLNNLYTVTNNFFVENIVLCEKAPGTVSLVIETKKDLYGIVFEIDNILNNFNVKLKKIINAFKTLQQKDKVKTTYGNLKIDDKLNCYWNNL